MKGSRCRDRALNPVCPEEINDPRSSVQVEEQGNVSTTHLSAATDAHHSRSMQGIYVLLCDGCYYRLYDKYMYMYMYITCPYVVSPKCIVPCG